MGRKLDLVINNAIKKSNSLKHEFLSLEALLHALLLDEEVQAVLENLEVDIDELSNELEDFLKEESNFSILDEEKILELSESQFSDLEVRQMAELSGIRYQPEISPSIQRVIQRSALHAQSSGKDDIRAINILVSIFQEEESYAVYLLKKYELDRFKIVQEVAHGTDSPLTDYGDEEGFEEGVAKKSKKQDALQRYSKNLNEMAIQDKIDPIIGRDNELKRIGQILCRRNKNNPLLVGDAGVGKTAVAEGLAWAIVNKKVPKILENTEIYSLDMAALLAGTKFRGDFEARFQAVLKELDKKSDEGVLPIIFMDELHVIMGAGSTSGGSMDASNLLKPALNAGKIRCMGSTTHEEYRRFVEKDHAFDRRFQKVEILEPSFDDTYKILKGLRHKYEEHHGVKYSDNVLKTAIKLASKYITDRKLPDKAIDVIDEAGAMAQLVPKSRKKLNITINDVEDVISFLAKVPKQTIAGSEKDKLQNLERNIKLLIFGQDDAIKKVTDAVIMSRSGLGNVEKPMACFLFTGPTGVGKTELARQLAFNLGVNFERFDMSEYMEKHAVSKLIGAPPGYIGHDRGGILTDAIKKNPYSVLLLDEIEKAHEDIFNILLQVMDHGVLTDSHGRSTDFRNIALIMTTNAGAKEMDSGIIGLADKQEDFSGKRDKVIKNFFTPEFRNRLDAIINFNKLNDENILKIVDKFLAELEIQLLDKKIDVKFSDEIKKWIAKNGFDHKMGARPIARLIDNDIKRSLSHEILFGKLVKGGSVTIDLKNNKPFFNFET